jgi:hypothetical protein
VPTDEWERGVVAFKPVPVFDVSQTEGEPLPEVDIAASGDASALAPALAAVAQEKEYDYSIVPESEWSHGSARGVCAPRADPPVIEVLKRENTADLARTAIHEFAHAELHAERSDDDRRNMNETVNAAIKQEIRCVRAVTSLVEAVPRTHHQVHRSQSGAKPRYVTRGEWPSVIPRGRNC